jgi:hypothetical protein
MLDLAKIAYTYWVFFSINNAKEIKLVIYISINCEDSPYNNTIKKDHASQRRSVYSLMCQSNTINLIRWYILLGDINGRYRF